MIYPIIDATTHVILAIFMRHGDALHYVQNNHDALIVPFNTVKHPKLARTLYVGEKYIEH
jgi:hypothetical protein